MRSYYVVTGFMPLQRAHHSSFHSLRPRFPLGWHQLLIAAILMGDTFGRIEEQSGGNIRVMVAYIIIDTHNRHALF